MKKIEKLTEEQKSKFPAYVKKWTEIGLCTKPANREKAEAGIIKAYAAVGLPAPKIVWTTSPLANGLTREILKKLSKEDFEKFLGDSVGASVRASVGDSVRDSVWASVRASVGASVGDSVWASVGASVGDSVRDSVWASVRASVGASVGDSVWASVGASVGDSVGASVRASVGASVWDSVRASVGASVWDSGYGQHDAAFTAYVEFFRNELGLADQTEKWEGNREIVENAGWYLPHKNICWVSERHTTLKVDDRGRLHCEDGPALEYPDGFGIYAWHGTKIPEEWIKDKKSLTPEIALKHQNMEQRRAACEILGWAKILKQLNAKSIDRDEDPQIGELLEVDIPDIGKEKFIRVLCGTGREFAIPVPPEMKTALQANAWTYGIEDFKAYKPEVRT
jgi:hypothetical protein